MAVGCQDACPLEIDGELRGALSWGEARVGWRNTKVGVVS